MQKEQERMQKEQEKNRNVQAKIRSVIEDFEVKDQVAKEHVTNRMTELLDFVSLKENKP